MSELLTQESQDAINKQVIIDGLRSERARHTAQLSDLTAKCEKLEQIQVIDKNNNDEYREIRAANLAVIHTLTAKLAALQLHWTSEKPTVPGWYWRRYNSSGVLIVEIVKIVSSGSKLVVRDFGGVIDFLLGEWAGPLVPSAHEPAGVSPRIE